MAVDANEGKQLPVFQVAQLVYPARVLGAAGIDEATPQGPKRLPALVWQSDFRSYCQAMAGPFSDCGVARKARLPPRNPTLHARLSLQPFHQKGRQQQG